MWCIIVNIRIKFRFKFSHIFSKLNIILYYLLEILLKYRLFPEKQNKNIKFINKYLSEAQEQ
jgi:hypothetical protein